MRSAKPYGGRTAATPFARVRAVAAVNVATPLQPAAELGEVVRGATKVHHDETKERGRWGGGAGAQHRAAHRGSRATSIPSQASHLMS